MVSRAVCATLSARYWPALENEIWRLMVLSDKKASSVPQINTRIASVMTSALLRLERT